MELNRLPNRNAAIRYIQLGWRIFPCQVRSRLPLVKWGTLASNDPEQITAWWREYPYASIGLATGSSSLVVVDLDALTVFAADRFLRQHPTLTSRTARGYHLVFTGSASSTVGAIAPGIDTRGRGGYVVLPPSWHPSGVKYQWHHDRPIAPFSAELRDKLSAPPTVVQQKKRSPLRGEKSGVIPIGQRNNQLFRTAVAMRSRGKTHGQILAELRRVNQLFCEEPLDDSEIQHIAGNVTR